MTSIFGLLERLLVARQGISAKRHEHLCNPGMAMGDRGPQGSIPARPNIRTCRDQRSDSSFAAGACGDPQWTIVVRMDIGSRFEEDDDGGCVAANGSAH